MDSKQQQSYWVQSLGAIGVAFELGFIIALPVAVLAFFGKKLDTHFGTHFIVYIGLVIALTSSVLWLYARLDALVIRLQKISKPDSHK
jgi:amino acid transporter